MVNLLSIKLRHFDVCKDADAVSFEVVYGIVSGNAIGLVCQFFAGMSARVLDVSVNSCCMRHAQLGWGHGVNEPLRRIWLWWI